MADLTPLQTLRLVAIVLSVPGFAVTLADTIANRGGSVQASPAAIAFYALSFLVGLAAFAPSLRRRGVQLPTSMQSARPHVPRGTTWLGLADLALFAAFLGLNIGADVAYSGIRWGRHLMFSFVFFFLFAFLLLHFVFATAFLLQPVGRFYQGDRFAPKVTLRIGELSVTFQRWARPDADDAAPEAAPLFADDAPEDEPAKHPESAEMRV